MSEFSRMPRYDIRNDGAGPYAVFYCDICGREFRSQPDVTNTVGQDIGRQAVGGFLRKVPLVGSAVADNVTGEDPRYSYKMTPAQLDEAWKQVQEHFRECPTCSRIVCLSDFDTQTGFCQEDSPRTDEIAEARGAAGRRGHQGLRQRLWPGRSVENARQAAEAAHAPPPRWRAARRTAPWRRPAPSSARSAAARWSSRRPPSARSAARTPTAPSSARNAAPRSKCPRATKCPSCGAETGGAKFCPECGTKLG